jgi:hypothetical protein
MFCAAAVFTDVPNACRLHGRNHQHAGKGTSLVGSEGGDDAERYWNEASNAGRR